MPPRAASRPAPPVKKPPAAAPRWLRPVILALSAFLLMGWFSSEVSDPDTWWLLKSGQYIWQTHKLPVPDPFAYTTYLGKPAFPGEEHMRDFDLTHEWLSEVFFYLVYAAGGFAGLVLLRAALLTGFCGVVGLVAFHRSRGFYRALGAAFLAASIADKFRSDRPFLIGFLLLALVVAALEYRRFLWLLPPVFVVWANMHGGFFLGWAPLGAYCAEALFLRWRGRPLADERRLWMVTAACILVSGLNLNGFRAVTILSTYQHSALQTSLWEWQHTALWPPEMFGVVLFAAAAALLWARGKARVADWLLFLAFAYAGIDVVRNVILMALIGPIVIASYIPWKRIMPAPAEFLVAVLVLAGAGAEIARGSAFQFRAAEWRYPGGAADFLLAHHVSEPMFNTYGYGGYLMWRLWPQERVFIDGRALNESVFQDYRRIAGNADSTGGKSGDELLAQYGIQVIVMDGFEFTSGEPYLLPAALSDPSQKEWKLVYQDAQAMVFMRHPPPGVAPLNPLDALASMEAQCAGHIRHVPWQPRCARGLGQLFARIGDMPRARQWMAFYLEHRTESDAEADSIYRRLLGTP
ncbi:MAG: hypothetical protein ABSH44_01510 [Bryobacteraceae bacterium]|jgi:hypothetical protein